MVNGKTHEGFVFDLPVRSTPTNRLFCLRKECERVASLRTFDMESFLFDGKVKRISSSTSSKSVGRDAYLPILKNFGFHCSLDIDTKVGGFNDKPFAFGRNKARVSFFFFVLVLFFFACLWKPASNA